MQRFGQLRFARPDVGRTILTGVAASGAYLAEQALDRRLTGNRYDDLLLWGGFFGGDLRRQRAAGAAVHFTFGCALAAAYAALAPSLPGKPGILRALIFTQIENLILFPGLIVFDALNPAVKNGTLPRLLTPDYFAVEVPRHLAYGAVLGLLEKRQ